VARNLIQVLVLLAAASWAQVGPSQAVVVTATYFHGDFRCPSCLKLERWSKVAIQTGLADSIGTGRLAWQTRNMDTPEGSALADRFGLASKALVLVETRGGRMSRFKELKETWRNLRDSTAFARYVKSETIAFLEAAR